MSKDMQARLEFMEFNTGQRATLRSAQPVVRKVIGRALDRFYSRAGKTEETAKFFSDAAHMAKAKAAQERHWAHIVAGEFDAEYYESSRRIGATHARIGLEPRWYVGGYAILVEELVNRVARRAPLWKRVIGIFSPSYANATTVALVKAALLDMEVSLSIYFEEAQATAEAAVNRLDEALEALADGDLSSELSNMPERFATLECSYNDTLSKVREMIGAVAGGAGRINSGLSEIALASEDLARRTESNAASLEQTSGAITQMNGRVRNSADAARSTVTRADQAIASVSNGRKITDEAVGAMTRVADSAKGIDDVIEGLDKIAFQTRVLAMNAAVEAGRAGEAGRGFAVVADLVSALAMRAEEEAGRARDQLTATQTDIVSAVEMVERVDGALADIAGDVDEVHGLLGTMATDNQAQATAIDEITTAIEAMDASTQQNAAMVEESSAAIRNLVNEADGLTDQTQAFRLKGNGSKGVILPPAHAINSAPVSGLHH